MLCSESGTATAPFVSFTEYGGNSCLTYAEYNRYLFLGLCFGEQNNLFSV